MNSGIIQVVMVGLLAAVLALTVKKQSPEIALMLTIATSVLIFFMVLPMLAEVMGTMRYVGQMLDGGQPYVSLAVKVIGVAYLAELGASVCLDAGESAIAAKIELAGRVAILVLAAPVVLDVAHVLVGLVP
jgi:stage III sporulation protein AD